MVHTDPWCLLSWARAPSLLCLSAQACTRQDCFLPSAGSWFPSVIPLLLVLYYHPSPVHCLSHIS